MTILIAEVDNEVERDYWCIFVPRSIYRGSWSIDPQWSTSGYVCIPFGKLNFCRDVARTHFPTERINVFTTFKLNSFRSLLLCLRDMPTSDIKVVMTRKKPCQTNQNTS